MAEESDGGGKLAVKLVVAGFLLAALWSVVKPAWKEMTDPVAARKAALEREADDWSRKGTVLPHEMGQYQAFDLEYRREFGRGYADPPPPKK